MNTLKSVIVEDEISSQNTLKNMLNDFCDGIEVSGIAGTVDESIKLIQKVKPDIVFLDIDLPEKNGFQLLDYFPDASFEIIFTTAHNQYAIKAFKLSAIDYLLKPIDLEELRLAISKVADKKKDISSREKYRLLIENMNNKSKMLSLPSRTGLVFVEIKNIIHCEADGNYTIFHMTTGEKHIVSKTLGIYDQLLSDLNFYRINRKDLVNLNHILELRRQKKMTVKLSDNSFLPITDSRKDEFLDLLGAV
ncbi:MAG: response regulator transcription factor [Saprospiraceae bacterium]|nr:response regulator transcription factor [Saprospiraceae bacterium]MCB9322662.1 response regulator transcription factor [Lewinellaceae bacterium]